MQSDHGWEEICHSHRIQRRTGTLHHLRPRNSDDSRALRRFDRGLWSPFASILISAPFSLTSQNVSFSESPFYVNARGCSRKLLIRMPRVVEVEANVDHIEAEAILPYLQVLRSFAELTHHRVNEALARSRTEAIAPRLQTESCGRLSNYPSSLVALA